MARRGVPNQINWYLPEWMAARGLTGRGAQARMMEKTGWSRATMSQLFNGTQDYSPKILGEAARALSAEPYELLMHPDKAMALRRVQTSAQEIATLVHDADAAQVDILKGSDRASKVGKPRGTGTKG